MRSDTKKSSGNLWNWFLELPAPVYVGVWILIGLLLPILAEWILAQNSLLKDPFPPSLRAASTVIGTVVGLYLKNAKEVDDKLSHLPSVIESSVQQQMQKHSDRAQAALHLNYSRKNSGDVAPALDQFSRFVDRTEQLHGGLHGPAYKIARSSIEDLQRLFNVSKGYSVPIYRVVDIYREVAENSTSLFLIEREPLDPTTQYSPDFINFISDIQRRTNFALTYILCCSEQTIFNDVSGPNRLELLSKTLFMPAATPMYWCDQDDLRRIGTDDPNAQNYYLQFGGVSMAGQHQENIVCVRPPSQGFEEFMSVSLVSKGTSEKTSYADAAVIDWIDKCKLLAQSKKGESENYRIDLEWLKKMRDKSMARAGVE